MRLGFRFPEAAPEYLHFAAQYGAKDIALIYPSIPGAGGRWTLDELIKLRLSVEQYGLKL